MVRNGQHSGNEGCEVKRLTFETMLSDPLIRLVMDSDGVSLHELVKVLESARASVVAREAAAIAAAMRG